VIAAAARSLDLTSLNDTIERKRLNPPAGAFILKQVTRALDDVTDIFIRQLNKMHHKAEEALMQYRVAHADRTDALIAVLQRSPWPTTYERSELPRRFPKACRAALRSDSQRLSYRHLRPVADLKRNVDIQIRDLDQTVIGKLKLRT
jgi:hypothetical protein